MGPRFSAPVRTGPGAHPTSYTMGTGSFSGVKRPGRRVGHPPPYSAEVKERVKLYLYSTSGPLWPVIGRNLPLPLQIKIRQSRHGIPYSDSLGVGAGCFGVRTLVSARFSALVLTGSSVLTAFSTKGTGFFLRIKEAGARRFPPTHPHLAPRLTVVSAIPLLPQLCDPWHVSG